jgi:tRNA(Ile)-lysidine synthase
MEQLSPDTAIDSFEAATAAGLGTWPGGTIFLVTVSGGADSTAMLAALGALRDRSGPKSAAAFELYCLHVEHGIRPADESQGDALAVKALCADLGIPCRVVSIAPGRIARIAKERGIGIEAAARLYRHRAWNREARRIGAAAILVAHTRDDALETTLMRFLRGSGPAGLAAMPRSRGMILRPILDRRRAEVLAYLAERGLPYRTDSTNADPVFLRNRIRHKLIPCLDEFFPQWRRTLPELAETQRMAADFLAGEAAARLPWEWEASPGSRSLEGHCVPEHGSLNAHDFFSQPPIIREEALFVALDRIKGRKGEALQDRQPRRRSLRLFTGEALTSLDLGFALLKQDHGRITISPGRREKEETGFSLLIKGPGVYKLKGLTIRAFSIGREPTGKETAAREFAEKASAVPLMGIPSGEDISTGEMPAGLGFFAGLPLALRRYYPGDYIIRGGRKRRAADSLRGTGLAVSALITAADPWGPVAFIVRKRDGFAIVLTREKGDRENHLFFSIN